MSLFEDLKWHLDYETYNGEIRKRHLKWKNIIIISLAHVLAFFGAWNTVPKSNWSTIIFEIIYGHIAGLGVTVAVHRFWCHRSFKANTILRIIMASMFSMTGQNTIPQWVLDHRVHHKFTETDADPHNADRGFFFSHCGWLMQEKCDAVKINGKKIDMSDVLNDPVVKYHTKFFYPLQILLCFLLPTVIPVYLFEEKWYNSFMCMVVRYMTVMNIVWSINSLAHLYGRKPYDRRIAPVDNIFMKVVALGEGWHNYHHVFPWDYSSPGYFWFLNFTTQFIDFFAKIGWAYDLKHPSKKLVETVATKYGDGSNHTFEVEPIKNDDEGPTISKIGEYEVPNKEY